MVSVWHHSTARAIREQTDPMLSNGSRGTLMSYTDHSVQRRLKSNAPFGCIRKLRQLTCCLAALWGNDFAGSVFARRHLTKLISDRLLRQRKILMIYNKIERVLVITKQIFNYYNTNFSLEITSKVNQKYTFTHKLTTKRNFQTPSLFFSSTVTEWNAQDCGISKAAKDTSMLPSKIDQMKVSHETGSGANFGFGRALMPFCLGMCPPKAAFFSFRMQPLIELMLFQEIPNKGKYLCCQIGRFWFFF